MTRAAHRQGPAGRRRSDNQHAWRVLALSIASGLCFAAFGSTAQPGLSASDFAVAAEAGAPGNPTELRAFDFVRQNKLIKARSVAEPLVRETPTSHVGHFVLAWAHHYGEANFPRALFHMTEAMRLFELQNGDAPQGPNWPWRWHARYLREMAGIQSDMEHYDQQLAYQERYNEHYQPHIIAERAWPLMKLRQFDAARMAAQQGLASGEPNQLRIALNALCAVEFEAGNNDASYTACRQALEASRTQGEVQAVDLTNFAESSRTVFRLAEAERTLLEATETGVSHYANPWLELGELYTRGARFAEALNALERVPAYRAARPAYARNLDRNESRRAIAAFLVAVGKPRDALAITEQAMVMPDRRAHNSRDPFQDRAVVALLDRRARLMSAEAELEDGATAGFMDRQLHRFQSWRLHFEAWLSGRQTVKLLSAEDRLVGTYRIGSNRSAIMPTWLLGELTEVVGPAITRASVREAREGDSRERAPAYYDAFLADAALEAGDEDRAVELATRSRTALGDGEAMLRARMDALIAESRRREGENATEAYENAIARDPGVFRRFGWTIPARLETNGGDVAEEVADRLHRSPRFDFGDTGLLVRVEADATRARICLLGRGNTVYDCAEATPESDMSPGDLAAAAVVSFHAQAFAPRIDLSQADIHGLDGSTATSRDPLQDMGLVP